MPTTIATSTAGTATAYSNQRSIDRTSNGVLWMIYWYGSGTGLNLNYSTDNGATWNNGGAVFNGSGSSTQSYTPHASLFIDQDDYAHVVFKDNSNGYIYYRRGTPNAGRTSWTWSAATLVTNEVTCAYPDIIAFRNPGSSPTTWHVSIIWSRMPSGLFIGYRATNIANDGTIGAWVGDGLGSQFADSSYSVTSYSTPTTAGFPSIDFNHTGDGKTVAGGAPHLYAAWSAGKTGTGFGIRFRKVTYSAGTWSWNTEVEIDSTQYVGNGYFFNCMFDGTRVVIAGSLDGTTSNHVIYERDAADTTTTTRYKVAQGSTAHFYGSSTYDQSGNVYIFSQSPWSGTASLGYIKWTRATSTAGSRVVVDSSVPDASTKGVYVSSKRGYSSERIEFIYTDGSASPYNVTYDSIILNQPPAVNLSAIGTFDPRLPKTISWTFSDVDAGNTQTAYELDYRVSGGTWSSLSTGTTASSYNVPANFFTDETEYEVRVRVKDATTWSVYDSEIFTTDSWTYYPEVQSSSEQATISTATLDTNSDYEVQVKVKDGYHYSAWSPSADLVFTRHYVYDGGVWKPNLKREYWINEWKEARSTNF